MVLEVKGSMEYLVNVQGQKKFFHANLNKHYMDRVNEVACGDDLVSVTVIQDNPEERYPPILVPTMKSRGNWEQAQINQRLTRGGVYIYLYSKAHVRARAHTRAHE